jgi:hypothetical protein
VCLPIFAVEGADVHPPYCRGVEAANVDTIAVGIRTRNIKRFDAAYPTEEMLGDAGVEYIGYKVCGSLK